MHLQESKWSRSPIRASGGLSSVKEFTDSFGLDNLMLSVYVEKINTMIRVGAVLDAVARMWDAEFLRRSTKPPAKIRGGSLAWRGAAKGGLGWSLICYLSYHYSPQNAWQSRG